MFFLEPSLTDVQTLIKVSRGIEPADLFIRGGTVANVYSGEYLPANVAIKGDRIAYVGQSEAAIGERTRVIDVAGKYVCPGYVEPHAHPWAIYNTVELCRALLALGTTSIFCDTLCLLLLSDTKPLEEFLALTSTLPIKVFWGARTAPQSPMVDEAIRFGTSRMERILEMPNTSSIAEITRWPQLLEGDEHFLGLISTARRLGKPVDGHTAGCSYEKLNAVAAAGVDSCHEAIDVQQALDRLRLGMYVILRDSSLREDLHELIKIVTENKVYAGRICMTTDGSSPLYYADKGSVEYMADVAVQEGVDPMTALRMITLNPATYYHLDHYLGGIAPGRMADIVINRRIDRFKPDLVIASGQVAAEDGKLVLDFPPIDWAQYPLDHPELAAGRQIRPEDLMVRADDAKPSFPVMDLVSAVISRRRDVELPIKDGFVDVSGSEGMLYISLLDRHGEWTTNGVIKGFARNLEGLASSYSTSCNPVVMGTSGEAMALAANRLYALGGGITVAERGRIIFELPLPLGGMMSYESFDFDIGKVRELMELLRQRGHAFEDPNYTLLFLSCDFLPEIRVTLDGLYDVKRRQVLRPRRAIRQQ